MRESFIRLTYLFNRYYGGQATADEAAELASRIEEAKDDSQLNDLLREAWENLTVKGPFFNEEESDGIFNAILPAKDADTEEDLPEPLQQYPWWRYAAAAVLLILGFGAIMLYQEQHSRLERSVAKVKITDPQPGGNRAMLTLADGSTILLDSAAEGLLAIQGNTRVSKTKNGQLVYDAQGRDKKAAGSQVNLISTPKCGQYQVVLPDGSKVWLNSSSSVKFPAVFSGHERKVEMTGEVYFEVVKNKDKPFRVLFSKTEVTVLGTSFNVMAYADEKSSETTLIEGAVALQTGPNHTQLRPGQQASVSTGGEINTRRVDVDEAIAWKSGLFYFRDAGIEEVLKKVSRWYDIEVQYQGQIPKRQFTGKVSMHVGISELLSMLRYAGVNCRIENKRIIVSS